MIYDQGSLALTSNDGGTGKHRKMHIRGRFFGHHKDKGTTVPSKLTALLPSVRHLPLYFLPSIDHGANAVHGGASAKQSATPD